MKSLECINDICKYQDKLVMNMALYAIADLHLSKSVDKPMDIFGENWKDHDEKIRSDWCKRVGPNDTVLIAGDISRAMHFREAKADLKWIGELPGRKILIKGNHDYWWKSISKLRDAFNNIEFLQNNFFSYKDYAICGSRGWVCPNDKKFTQHDEKIYKREVHRLKLSLEAAEKHNYKKKIVMLHYPPTNDKFEPSQFTELITNYGVEVVVYGHLHGPEGFGAGIEGQHNGISYHLVSCDFLDFKLLKIAE